MLLLLLQVLASCLWLGHSEVVTSFESSCPQFFFQNTPPNEALVPENPAWICQRYKNQYYFATLYDMSRRIPVYSAYIYQPGSGKRPNTWLIEPQLISPAYPKTMERERTLSKEIKITLEEIGKHQAVLQDYKNLTGLNRGHLNPNSHHSDFNSRTATFTLTNIVPQNEKLNGGAWNNYEQQTMIKNTKGCNNTYVVVGAVPGNNYIANGRVNKPSYIWASACCELNTKDRKTWAVIAENDRDEVKSLTLGELEDKLTQLYGRSRVSLFDSACPRK
ncbi:endonuclease domain-containing 1 protein-like [Melopsittacus undulatus]|uniref:endonuclease domain-containing 1 protein-like n=1 Tax=Melopsittacus undulatus TaxID=13146 RepID=UPI00146E0AFC|nr:endonuclease domain-containing 1 protein-like [Melopsittacus undulatus]XP_033918804.1 endonuclease domain-containing 1 protein-like [Melopsittacus undulatus]